MKHTILIFSQAMELGGVERSLLGLLDAIDYDRYDVDLFLMRHGGESFNNAVGRDPEYSGGRDGSCPDVKKDKFGFLWKFCCTHLRDPDIIQMSGRAARAAERKACGTAL